MNRTVKKYDFFRTKYGEELLIDLIRLESLEKYITEDCPHSLSYYDITLISGGKGFFSIDQYRYPIEPGTVVFSSPGQVRFWDIEHLPTGYALIFEEEFLSCFLNDSQFISGLKYFNNYFHQPKLNLSIADNQYLTNLMQDIEQEISTFNLTDKHVLRALLYQSLFWLNRKYLATYPVVAVSGTNRHIRSFINVVNHEFSNHHSVAYYAGVLNITSGHLNDLCKCHLGMSAKQYIQNRVVTEAKRLLLYSDMPISEIAFRLNFDDTSYFVRKFRMFAGTTPLSYRKAQNP